MYIAVCDDCQNELKTVTDLLNTWQEEHKTVLKYKTFQNTADLLESAINERFSLYLLDVVMPGSNGIEAAQYLRGFDNTAGIVFLTSSTGFAYESYGVHALDYLLKPISKEKLFPILDKLFTEEQNLYDCLSLKCGQSFIRIPFSQITYVEVINKHLYFNLTDGQVREIVGSLRDYEPLLLGRPEFMKVHRSYIANMLQVSEFSPTAINTFSGKIIPVSRLLHQQLQKDYMDLMFMQREVK